MPVQIPDDTDFSSFKEQCENHEGWTARYNKGSVTVWCRDEECKTIQKLKASVSLLQIHSGTSGAVLKEKALHCGEETGSQVSRRNRTIVALLKMSIILFSTEQV